MRQFAIDLLVSFTGFLTMLAFAFSAAGSMESFNYLLNILVCALASVSVALVRAHGRLKKTLASCLKEVDNPTGVSL